MKSKVDPKRNLDLKKVYRRNLALGFGVSAGTFLTLVAILLILTPAGTGTKAEIRTTVIDSIEDILRVQSPIRCPGPTRPRVDPPIAGIPVPVLDKNAPEEVDFPRQIDIGLSVRDDPINLDQITSLEVDVGSVLDSLLPPPDVFVACEEPPFQVATVPPIYPELARRAGIEGDVWIKVLVDRAGKVRDVLIEKKSGDNAGFEESAADAARKCVWRPAIANGEPIAVWVTYKVSFRLK